MGREPDRHAQSCRDHADAHAQRRLRRAGGIPHPVTTSAGRERQRTQRGHSRPGRFVPWRRHTEQRVLDELQGACRRALSAIARRRNLMFEFKVLSEITPVKCSSGLVDQIKQVADDLNIPSLRMASGAAHDAQMLAGITRAAMVFVPSKDGRSHSAAEWTDMRDIERGADVLLNTLARLAGS
ncbi:MAG: M20/M25/M40 family metallo-hydrolase [Gammaproteobacteria bacterium]